jgi:Uma2 family endonuclease
MNAVTTPPSKPKEQRFIQTGVSWEGFKAIQKGFADSPGVRLFYYKGEVEILGVSPDHESISRMITGLLIVYFLEKEIEFNPLGSFTQEKEEKFQHKLTNPLPSVALHPLLPISLLR